MGTIAALTTLACDGCFQGYPAIISTVIIILALIGSIYVLLWSNFGARVGYLVTMTSLAAIMIIMSLLWLIGAPGTTTGTGPRGREPAWVPFTADSEVAQQDFPEAVGEFPTGGGWEEPGTIYPGEIDSAGELITVSTAVRTALANLAHVNELPADEPGDWAFRPPGEPLTDQERQTPVGTIRFRQEGNHLLFGVTIPATDDHREVTVFAFRDKGLVYIYSLYFLLISIAGFALHLWLLVRHERKQEETDQQLESETVTVGS